MGRRKGSKLSEEQKALQRAIWKAKAERDYALGLRKSPLVRREQEELKRKNKPSKLLHQASKNKQLSAINQQPTTMNPAPHIKTEGTSKFQIGEIKNNTVHYNFEKIKTYLNIKGHLLFFFFVFSVR